MEISSRMNWQEVITPHAVKIASATALVASIMAIASAVFLAPPPLVAGFAFTAVLLTALSITLFVKSRLQVSPVAENPAGHGFDFTAKVDIQTRTHGRFCKPSEEQNLPDYFQKIYLEDGRAFSLSETDSIVDCSIWDCTLEGFPKRDLWLPMELFAGKQFGDWISLQYEGKKVGLQICKQFSGFTDLKEVLATISAQENKIPVFGIYTPPNKLKLDENAAFYCWIDNNEGQPVLTKGEAVPLAKSVDLVDPQAYFGDEKIGLVAPFAGFPSLEHLDFVINDDEWIIYGDRTRVGFAEKPKDEERYGYKNGYQIIGIPRQIALRLNWKKLLKCSLRQMIDQLPQITFSLEHGLLKIVIPKPLENR